MSDQAAKSEHFLALHTGEAPLLLANAWDVGSARLFESLGFKALATTSGGHAASLGRLDYGVVREEALAHAATLAEAVDLPVSADLEDCFPEQPGGVERTVALARAAGLAGCSIEDWGGDPAGLYDLALAAERVAAAAQAAHVGPCRLVLTARAENYLRGNADLEDTITRLLAYQEAGADVLYAPGLDSPEELRKLVAAVDRPVNVLVKPTTPSVAELAELGVKRISVGGALAFLAYGTAAEAAREWLEDGTHGFSPRAGEVGKVVRTAFGA
jgi:2-methylisocitrate lyase-like PEP mutase family enzyme